MESATVSKLQIIQSRLQATQFVYQLDSRTLLPIELAAPAIGKSTSTFRSDLCRRPDALPRVTRQGGRVLVRVADLLDFIDNGPQPPQPAPAPSKKRGRPTRVEQIARQRQQAQAFA